MDLGIFLTRWRRLVQVAVAAFCKTNVVIRKNRLGRSFESVFLAGKRCRMVSRLCVEKKGV